MTDDTTLANVHDYLSRQSTLTVATVDPGGNPLAAALFFAADPALRLYVASSPDSRHAQAFERQAHVAVTVQAETWAWPSITGIQIAGTAHASHGPDRATAIAVYTAKFPFVAELGSLLDQSAFYTIVPHWLRWIDNRQGFGHKTELHFTSEGALVRPPTFSPAAPP